MCLTYNEGNNLLNVDKYTPLSLSAAAYDNNIHKEAL
jgi:hypothetical protein